MSERKISIAIPTYERTDLLFKSFEAVYDDPRVDEIVIVDDASSMEVFEEVRERCARMSKVKLHRNVSNRDCYFNKYVSLSFCKNDWCILLDSDNMISKQYLDKIFQIEEWVDKTVYMPSFAAPLFDYKHFSGMKIDKSNVSALLNEKLLDTMLNCMNYFVNRHQYIKVWQSDINPHTADSILQNYNWFAAGNVMYVVPGLEYFHRVHDGSHYRNNVHKTGNMYNEIIEKLKLLK